MALCIACAVFASTPGAEPAYAATFTINSTGDGGDALLADGICADAGGACTFRAAIQQANFTLGGDIVNFGIGSGAQTISPASALPTITQPLTINATTQPGFAGSPIIELSGSVAGGSANGLTVAAGGTTIRGLVIRNWGGYGIELNTLGGNVVAGNHVGTDATGSAAQGNAMGGVLVNGSANNTIGGAIAADRNVISGNESSGVRLEGATASDNVVSGNYIGVDASGGVALGNTGVGVSVASPNNTIGGDTAAERNVISGNVIGISLAAIEASGNVVSANFIGTDATGGVDVGNLQDGVSMIVAGGNTIGGASPAQRNVISGNGRNGVDQRFTEVVGNTIQNNYIGTNASGTGAMANASIGVFIAFDADQLAGSTSVRDNVVSGNDDGGMLVQQTGALIRGNLVGVQADGVTPLGNGGRGIQLVAPGIVVGGPGAGEPNVIAFNAGAGVTLSAPAVSGIPVRGNSIHSNALLGIDLGLPGVTPNDSGDGDTGPNDLQNFPVITSVVDGGSTTQITGTLNSTASTTFELDFYANTTCDSSGHGEGETYIGSASVATDGSGNASFDETFTFTLAGRDVAATTTNPGGSTSEFSFCFGAEQDTDGDGCSDAEESGPNPTFGGDRDMNSPWDFFDVPTPALRADNTTGIRTKAVTLADVGAVLFYVGTTDGGGTNSKGVDYDTDYNTNTVDDGREYDRTPSADSNKPWRSGPPNGAVSLSDVGVSLVQVGDNCGNPP